MRASTKLDPKFLWSYDALPGTKGAELEAQGWHGLANQSRFPDLAGDYSPGNYEQWANKSKLLGHTTQTADPDMRVKFYKAPDSEQPVVDGGVAVRIGTAYVSNLPGFWSFDESNRNVGVAHWSAAKTNQIFTVKDYAPASTAPLPHLDADSQAADEDLLAAAEEEEADPEVEAQEAVLSEAPAADECLPIA
eukprot:tig00021494_g21918.t1